ncbi:prepilin peptidase, partial [Mycobacterium avium subsp. hominissuis]|nr:prepilin peptidase [Mycobacterium avium subsp. hominissuis]
HAVAPGGMGAGDVKLALGVGALTGCGGVGVWFLAALAAPLLTALVGVLARVRRAGPAVPHGPSLCLAAAAGAGLALF